MAPLTTNRAETAQRDAVGRTSVVTGVGHLRRNARCALHRSSSHAERQAAFGGQGERTRYHRCGRPGVFIRSVWTEVRAVKNSVRRSGPPKARLAGTSGVRMMPSWDPSGAKTHVLPGPVQ